MSQTVAKVIASVHRTAWSEPITGTESVYSALLVWCSGHGQIASCWNRGTKIWSGVGWLSIFSGMAISCLGAAMCTMTGKETERRTSCVCCLNSAWPAPYLHVLHTLLVTPCVHSEKTVILRYGDCLWLIWADMTKYSSILVWTLCVVFFASLQWICCFLIWSPEFKYKNRRRVWSNAIWKE